MFNNEIPKFQVDFIPNSHAFLTCMEVIDKTDSPTQLINVLSHVDKNKFNQFEQEYLKKMALNTLVNNSVSEKDMLEVMRNFNVTYEQISDLDYKLSSLITDNDLKAFD